MRLRRMCGVAVVAIIALLGVPVLGAAGVSGSFVVQGKDAGLKHVRASRVELEKGKNGFVVLLSARPAEGDIMSWRTADPAERGSFICVLLEANGSVWVAELGHAAAKSGRFGVVTELQAKSFSVTGNKISVHLLTSQEQSFGEDRFKVDLKVEGVLEK